MQANPFATAVPWRFDPGGRSTPPGDGFVSPQQFVDRLRKLGYRVDRRSKYWMAVCPLHDDHDPSLQISHGQTQKLLLKCWGCGASFSELLKAVGLGSDLKRLPISLSLLEIYGCSDHPHYDLGAVSDIEVVFWERDFFRSGSALMELPPRAGRLMRAVADDVVLQANVRRWEGNYLPIAYGCDFAAKWLHAERSHVRRALSRLEEFGSIKCVGQLDDQSPGRSGAKLYALRVQVYCSECQR